MRSAQTAAADKGQSVELSRYPLQRVLVKVASVGAYYCTNKTDSSLTSQTRPGNSIRQGLGLGLLLLCLEARHRLDFLASGAHGEFSAAAATADAGSYWSGYVRAAFRAFRADLGVSRVSEEGCDTSVKL